MPSSIRPFFAEAKAERRRSRRGRLAATPRALLRASPSSSPSLFFSHASKQAGRQASREASERASEMDVDGLRKQLVDVEKLLESDPANEAYVELRNSLTEALALADSDSDSDSDAESEAEAQVEATNAAAKQTSTHETLDENEKDDAKAPAQEHLNVARSNSKAQDNEATAMARTDNVTEPQDDKKTSPQEFTLPDSMRQKRQDLEKIVLGSVCEAFDKVTGVWNSAILEQYTNVEQGKCQVRFLYKKDDLCAVDPEGVRPIKAKTSFDKMSVQIGQPCEARFSGDGKRYAATVLRLTPHGCVVRFKRYNNEEEVAYQHLRLLSPEEVAQPTSDRQAIAAAMSGIAPASATSSQASSTDLSAGGGGTSGSNTNEAADSASGMRLSQDIASIPEHLRVKEGDSEKVKERKRKALRLLKKQTKAAKRDLALEQKKQGWKAFQAKSKLKKRKR
ncbi:Tudor domain-containing protein 1 [Hondaea fermentalgiana]|uniref:Tudor domain-containing protein 1 n=1 Tax=Hondaea fermentalgiana TaxID=2315210 RepID=A0A2R5GA70_9STRA|nr:Tudor domain-containing protein 1 [Hondaea fermentalgiana]|eukprot:GBG27209.1 Tudor domain-containing protein 1 [Hondaea fermentalgiana]